MFWQMTFNIPIRVHSLIVSLFVLQNILLLFVGLGVSDYNVYYDNLSEQYSNYIAYRAGVICMAELVLVILFAGRNNILLWITGWQMDTFNVFHKWIARTTVMNAVVHSIGYTIAYIEEGYYYTMFAGVPGNPWWNWGIAAVIIFCIMIAQSAHPLRTLNYEVFLYLHIVLTLFAIPAVWIHVIGMEGMKYLYAAIALWAFDHVARISRIIWSGVTSKADMKLHGDSIIELKIEYSQRWKFYPGCHAYLHILRPNRFWQSHPFTLVTSPREDDDGKLVVFCRVKKGLTKYTANFLASKPDRTGQAHVLVEGPYGGYHPLHHYDTVVLMAGGVGVTSIYPYAAQLRDNKDRSQRMTFIWTIRDVEPLAWFSDQLKHISEDSRIEVIIYVTGSNNTPVGDQDLLRSCNESEKSLSSRQDSLSSQSEDQHDSMSSLSQLEIRSGTPDLNLRVSQDIKEAQGTVAFLVCGPDRMNDDVRQGIANNIIHSKHRIDYFEDAFSW